MSGVDPTGLVWRKSSRSGAGGNSNCVELAHLGTVIAVRDSKNPAAGTLLADLAPLLAHLKQGH
jgi:hypothetical protein